MTILWSRQQSRLDMEWDIALISYNMVYKFVINQIRASYKISTCKVIKAYGNPNVK